MKLYLLTTFLLLATALQAQTIVVTGFAQKGNKVEINYTIESGNAQTEYLIKVKGYDENTPNALLPMKTLQGTGKQTGNGKRSIIWDAGTDMNSLFGYSFVFEVSAEYTVLPDPDLQAYQVAQTANTCKSYTDYLANYPSGKYKTEAESKKTQLCKVISSSGSFTYKTETVAGIAIDFALVPAGSFIREGNTITLSSFYMAKTEITQELYLKIMGTNPSNFKNNTKKPVEYVSW